jgi:DNA repair protein RadC
MTISLQPLSEKCRTANRLQIIFKSKTYCVMSANLKIYNSNPINSWALEDRPREKMSMKGRNALTDAELIAILLGTGTKDKNALDIAKNILVSAENNLNALGELSLRDLQKIRGIGEAKAIVIAAAMELGRRRMNCEAIERPQIKTSADAYRIIYPILSDLGHEEFWILPLSRANRVLGKVKISSGGLCATVVDTKKLFQRALEFERVNGIILCHNHPSGNLQPSQHDLDLTRKIFEAALLLDLRIYDHIIVAGTGYVSFVDKGFL